MNAETFEYMEKFYDEVEPQDFYRRIFGEGHLSDGEGHGDNERHATIQNLEETASKSEGRPRLEKVWDDLTNIQRASSVGYPIAIAPVSFIGYRRKNKNAREMFALAVDLDYIVPEHGMGSLFSQIDKAEVLPRPTFTVCSGNGLHLYYQFTEPIPCYEYNFRKLKTYKAELTRKLWNKYITTEYKKPQYESLFQTFRVVGSLSKDEDCLVRAFETGDKVTTEYLDTFVLPEYQIGNLEDRGGLPLDFWKIKDPDWYERRIVRKEPRRTWVYKRNLYDKWLERIRNEASVGHRYYAVMCLAINAKKCGVPFKELERDAYSLIPLFEAMTVKENNSFTEKDVKSALRAYDDKYMTFPRKWIDQLCNIRLTPTKRNHKTRAEHLEYMKLSKSQKAKRGQFIDGRPSKAGVVWEWRENNPEGTKAACIKETGLAKSTVYRHWERNEAEKQDKTLTAIQELLSVKREQDALQAALAEGSGIDTDNVKGRLKAQKETLDRVAEYISKMPPDKQKEWARNNQDTLRKIVEELKGV